jgi:ribosomal protein L37AE/L43A
MAYRKKCRECGEYSYSASQGNLWRCPICKADITDIEAKPAGAPKEGK